MPFASSKILNDSHCIKNKINQILLVFLCVTLHSDHTHTSDTSLYSLFPETVFSVFIIRLFPLLECPPPPMLVDIFLLILQGPGKTQYVLRSPLRSILLWLISFHHAPQHCVSNFSISECSLY